MRSPTLLDSASATIGRGRGPGRPARRARRLSNIFWLGCGRPATPPNSEPRWSRQALQVQGLHARARPAGQDLGLARPRAAVEQDELQRRRLVVEPRLHMPPIGAVAARQHRRPPADLRQDGGHGVGPLAAAPAVDQRPKVGRLVGERGLQVPGDVAGHQRRADAAGQEARLLDVDRAHPRPLGVVEHGQADGAGHVVLGELRGAAHVDDRVEGREGLGIDGADDLDVGHDRRGPPLIWVGRRLSPRTPFDARRRHDRARTPDLPGPWRRLRLQAGAGGAAPRSWPACRRRAPSRA